MKQLLAIAFSSLLLVAGVCTPAHASIISYSAMLSGSQERPIPNLSTATASAIVTVDDVLNTVFVSLTFSGLTGGNAAAGHIHCCSTINGSAPVVIPFTGFPSATSGSYSNLFTGVSALNIAGIEAGLAYVNIHDAQFPGGEIRGNILQRVPEPEVVALFGLGLVALAGLRRSRPRAS